MGYFTLTLLLLESLATAAAHRAPARVLCVSSRAHRDARHVQLADTALRLGHWFGTSAEMWLNLQKLYELRLAEQEKGAEIRKLPKRKAA